MRLKSIKLAGFKSFVDAASVHLPSNLTAIVGPNGCGKSNIIDAVRWVMGEGSAKTLRGESMADVIFSGSASRAPVGQASIELIFDNAEGALGGAFAAYAEISIRRQVSRDGQSHYSLNGSKCRRRDITDLFLGTGLGSRSYAIIEQGMISRLVEARPEELRQHIEEAAGISRYKERRRESESRIQRTRENLARLDDLRAELSRQLERLQKQAQSAEKYRSLKAQERTARAHLAALRLCKVQEECTAQEKTIQTLELSLQAQTAAQRESEARLEQLREAQFEHSESSNRIQARLYAAGADLARVEQNIQHHQQRLRQLQKDCDEAEKLRQQGEQQSAADRALLSSLGQQLAALDGQHALALAVFEEHSAALEQAEETLLARQSAFQQGQQDVLQPERQVSARRSEITQLEASLARLDAQQRRLDTQAVELAGSTEEEAAALLQEQLAEAALRHERLQQDLQQAQAQQAASRLELKAVQAQIQQQSAPLQPLRGRLAALQELQRAALNPAADVATWLRAQHLDGLPRLAEKLRVEAGWEAALACVLGADMQALLLDDVGALPLDSFNGGALHLRQSAEVVESASGSLLDKIREGRELLPELAAIATADSLAQALAMRDTLKAGQSVVSRDGCWLGKHFLRLSRGQMQPGKVLQRREEIDRLAADCAQREEETAALQERLLQLEDDLHQQEARCEQLRRETAGQAQQQAQLAAQHSASLARDEQLAQRRAQLGQAQGECRAQRQMEAEQLAQARLQLAEAETLRAEVGSQQAQRQSELAAVQQQVQPLRRAAREQQAQVQQLAVQQGKLRERERATAEALARLAQQIGQASERREQLKLDLQQADEPLQIQRAQLETLLSQRLGIEDELHQAHTQQQHNEQALRAAQTACSQHEQEARQQQSHLQSAHLAAQTLAERARAQREQLQQEGFNLQRLLEELPPDAGEVPLAARLEALAAQIQRLGAINLAAIEEYQQQSERKTYLDAQNDDLLEALETLTRVIRKIDRETKSRFAATFEQVNQGLQQLFPKIFGGGSAFLQMTGKDLLDTGVTLMARPPGKKNSHLALLSGGEKALTALALVFAIFNLNPAPFCLLDEVDAPLDDANVERYARLLKEMSAKVQFIYITHNKIAMQMASQLLGVTMHEAGCSRLVAVDIDEALAQAA